jgi:diguanylate cyclase (GGDEF)-like protein
MRRRGGRIGTALALCLLGALWSPRALAGPRPMRFARLSVDEGLSQSTVFSVFQDSVGYMWLGTEDGLTRYDGYAFKVYRHRPHDPASLPNNFVWQIDEDASGDLWIGTDGGGLARWRRKSDTFVSYRADPADGSSLPSDQVRAVEVGRSGLVWVGTKGGGLARLDPRTGRFVRYRHDPASPASLASDIVNAIYERKDGTVWVGTSSGIDRFDAATSGFRHQAHAASDPGSLSDDDVRSIFEDRQGTLWIGTFRGGLNRLARGALRFEHFRHDPRDPRSLSDDCVHAVLEDRVGRLWVATRSGLDLRGPGGHFARYSHDAANPLSLGDDEAMALYEDRGGVLWVGTRAGGVSKWNPATWGFGHVAADPRDPDGLSNDYVTSFSEDASGRLWVGTMGGGINVLERRTGRFLHYRANPARPGSLSDDRVMTLLHDREGSLWAGTMDGGLNRFDAAHGTFEAYRSDPTHPGAISSNAVTSLFEDHEGTLWVGTYGGGLNRMDRRRRTFSVFRHSASEPRSLSSDIVTCIIEGRSGELWIGTERGGLDRLDPGTGEFRSFRHDPNQASSLGDDTVYSLHLDADGILWVGTRAGLHRLDDAGLSKGTARFKVFNQTLGLPNDVIYGIEPDGSGRLWLSTNGGLVRFDPRTETLRDYSASHGLQGNEFNFGAHYRSARGELLFGGPGGFNQFFPERLQTNEHKPPVVLTALLQANRPVAGTVPVANLEAMQLGYRDVVTFEFAALDFAAPERNLYKYKLEGFDVGWIDLGTVHRVTYTNLDAGNYQLRVKAANNDGVWNEKDLTLRLHVVPPFWRSWWAYSLCLLAFSGALLAFLRSERRKVAREVEYRRRLELEVQARTQELARQNTKLEKLNEQLLQTSLTDALTGLRNRRFLFEELPKEISLVMRGHEEKRLGVREHAPRLIFMMVDLDWFKPINDTCGHAAGDRVLVQVRAILEKACRTSDVLIRWGGDEFLVVGRANDVEGVEVVPERIRTMIEQSSFDLGDGQVAHITCSIGFTCYPSPAPQLLDLSIEQIVGLADAALYAAKKAGRNAWVGLLGTEQATSHNVVRSLQSDPEHVVQSGHFEVLRSSNELSMLLASRIPVAAAMRE